MKSRICNLNSFSSVIDRLIIENLKLISFIDNHEDWKIKEQEKIISGLKQELDEIFNEFKIGIYKSTEENRTYNFDINGIIDNIFKLCVSDYVIGKIDKEKVQSAEDENIDPKIMRNSILQVRDYLEYRSYIKNEMERHL
jgi:hypothetical protein